MVASTANVVGRRYVLSADLKKCIDEWLTQPGNTQPLLAEQAQISLRAISKVLNGEREYSTFDLADRIMQAMGDTTRRLDIHWRTPGGKPARCRPRVKTSLDGKPAVTHHPAIPGVDERDSQILSNAIVSLGRCWRDRGLTLTVQDASAVPAGMDRSKPQAWVQPERRELCCSIPAGTTSDEAVRIISRPLVLADGALQQASDDRIGRAVDEAVLDSGALRWVRRLTGPSGQWRSIRRFVTAVAQAEMRGRLSDEDVLRSATIRGWALATSLPSQDRQLFLGEHLTAVNRALADAIQDLLDAAPGPDDDEPLSAQRAEQMHGQALAHVS